MTGTIEAGPSLTLVSQGTGQRFALAPTPGESCRAVFEVLLELHGTVTLTGLAERVDPPEHGADIILHVEGHETVRPQAASPWGLWSQPWTCSESQTGSSWT